MGRDGSSTFGSLLKQPATSDRWPRGIAYSGGFYILGTPIGLGGAERAGLRFISTLDERLPHRGSRVIGSRFVTAAIGAEKRGFDTLGLDFGQKIKLGRMEICLYPAGLGPGSAQFHVTFKNVRILFCGGICLRRPISSQPAEVPQCDVLLLDVAPARSRPPAPVRVGTHLTTWVRSALTRGRTPVLLVGSRVAAFDALWALRSLDTGIRAQRQLYETCRRVEAYYFFSSQLRRIEQSIPEAEIVLYPSAAWPLSPFHGQSGIEVAYIGPGQDAPPWVDTVFRLGEGEGRQGLIEYAKRTGAATVAMGSRCDPGMATALSKTGVSAYQMSLPQQLPLPL